MWYLTVLAVAIAAIGTWFFFKKASPDGNFDVNKDGKVNVNDVKAVADINKDGKITEADAKVAVAEVVAEVKTAAVEVKKVAEVQVTKTVAKAKKTAAAGVKKAVTKAKK